jgi:hypothetical protein
MSETGGLPRRLAGFSDLRVSPSGTAVFLRLDMQDGTRSRLGTHPTRESYQRAATGGISPYRRPTSSCAKAHERFAASAISIRIRRSSSIWLYGFSLSDHGAADRGGWQGLSRAGSSGRSRRLLSLMRFL